MCHSNKYQVDLELNGGFDGNFASFFDVFDLK